jgi:hypothetical protein
MMELNHLNTVFYPFPIPVHPRPSPFIPGWLSRLVSTGIGSEAETQSRIPIPSNQLAGDERG